MAMTLASFYRYTNFSEPLQHVQAAQVCKENMALKLTMMIKYRTIQATMSPSPCHLACRHRNRQNLCSNDTSARVILYQRCPIEIMRQ
ncbi:hypothetical protein ACFX1T_019224 [Malus domestica]